MCYFLLFYFICYYWCVIFHAFLKDPSTEVSFYELNQDKLLLSANGHKLQYKKEIVAFSLF